MSGFRFESYFAFMWLWVVPGLILVNYFFTKKFKNKIENVFSKKLYPYLTTSLNLKRRKWKRILEFICLFLMILAYARPQTPEGEQTVKNEGVEIVFLLDVSQSMLAQDIKPSRLDYMKSEINRFIQSSNGDRMSLVAFAGSSILLTPMTPDKEALRMFVESLSVDSVSTQGTVFKSALEEAQESFKRGGLGDQAGSHATRVIVIASDGEDQEPGAYDVAKKLVDSGVSIFTIAFGTEAGAPIPIYDRRDERVGFRRDKGGEPIISKTNGNVLKELARIGNGAFYHASLQSNVVSLLRDDLNKLEKAEFESSTMKNYSEKYQPILFLALMIALLELLLGERRKSYRIWKGRFELGVE
jgi:Ca-activated chloride channel family protein